MSRTNRPRHGLGPTVPSDDWAFFLDNCHGLLCPLRVPMVQGELDKASAATSNYLANPGHADT